MTLDEFIAQLEAEWNDRSDELRQLSALVAAGPEPHHDDRRRPLVLLLYAHLEGHCVFALRHYLAAINGERLHCREMAPAILAGALDRTFRAMETGDKKADAFRNSLPEDRDLHRHWRRREFIAELDRFLNAREELSERTVDAESNLKPAVLKRNLFLLGLDPELVDSTTAGALSELLGRRNRIAHGEQKGGVPAADYKRYEERVLQVVGRLRDVLVDAFREGRYLRFAGHMI